jgi:hypothetical protein
MSMSRKPTLRSRASTTAFMIAGQEPMLPASPAPLMPIGLVVEGTFFVSKWKNGTSPARGMA